MKLEEALVELRKGRKIRWKHWEAGKYIHKLPSGEFRCWSEQFQSKSSAFRVELLTGDEWEVVTPPPMSFGDAMNAVAEGKTVTRGSAKSKRLKLDYYGGILYLENDGEGLARLTIADLKATDWEVVE